MNVNYRERKVKKSEGGKRKIKKKNDKLKE